MFKYTHSNKLQGELKWHVDQIEQKLKLKPQFVDNYVSASNCCNSSVRKALWTWVRFPPSPPKYIRPWAGLGDM